MELHSRPSTQFGSSSLQSHLLKLTGLRIAFYGGIATAEAAELSSTAFRYLSESIIAYLDAKLTHFEPLL